MEQHPSSYPIPALEGFTVSPVLCRHVQMFWKSTEYTFSGIPRVGYLVWGSQERRTSVRNNTNKNSDMEHRA